MPAKRQPIKMVPKRESDPSSSGPVTPDGVNIAFDIDMLDTLIKYIRCDYVTQPQKMYVRKLFRIANLKQYEYLPDMMDRCKLIRTTCEAICVEHILDESLLMSYLRAHLEEADEILKNINFERNQLTDSECRVISRAVNEKLETAIIIKKSPEIIDGLRSLNHVGFTSIQDDLKTLRKSLSDLLVELQGIVNPDQLIRRFNFSGDQYVDLLTQILEKAKKPTTTLLTGIRQLNAILAPGFQSGRLYTILGGTGRFKSGTLWNLVDQIRQFNPQIKPVENGMRKTILFVTMENTIYETIIRLIDMYNPVDTDIREMDVEDVVKLLREQGKFIFTAEDGIDIEMMYYSDLEIATSHLYTIIQELRDEGKEVIALVLDYILKIDSAKPSYGDERTRLSYVGRELKALAQALDIAVITAMQFNREGNGILEASMQENKEDILRFVGSSYIGQCWDIVQESDWICAINLEMQQSTGKWFLSFKRLKIRGKQDLLAATYFNHPFVNNNGIRLQPDVDLPEPVSVISLASDLVNIDDTKMDDRSARQRPTVSSAKKQPVVVDINNFEGLLKAS